MLGSIGMYQYGSGMYANGYNNSGIGMPYGIKGNEDVASMSKTGEKSPIDTGKCETCENRRYQDASNEQVSYKAPGKIRPQEAYGKVMSHEKEHVANAVAEGTKPGKELVSASVSLKMDICPDCGRSYVAGGTTTTIMKTYKGDAYSQNQKSYEAEATKGNNINLKG